MKITADMLNMLGGIDSIEYKELKRLIIEKCLIFFQKSFFYDF